MLNGASLAVEASGSSGQHFPALAGCFMWGDKTRRHARKARTTFWFALPGVLLVGALVPDIAWSQAETDVKQPGKVVGLQAEPRDEPGGAVQWAVQTRKIQDALDGSAVGDTVRLVPADQRISSVFEIGSICVPAGVTLEVSAGVTLIATNLPRDSGTGNVTDSAIIQLAGDTRYPATLRGDGVIQGGIYPDEVNPTRSNIAQGRTLISASGKTVVTGVTLHGARETAVRVLVGAELIFSHALIISATGDSEARGITFEPGAGSATLEASSIVSGAQQITFPAGAGMIFTAREVNLYGGTGVEDEQQPGLRGVAFCQFSGSSLAAELKCVAESLPGMWSHVYVPENAPGTVRAVARPLTWPQNEVEDEAQIWDGQTLLATAPLVNGVAEMVLPASLGSGRHHLDIRLARLGVQLESVDVEVRRVRGEDTSSPLTTTALSTTSLSTTAAAFEYGELVVLTANVTPNTATGIVTFLDGAGVLGQATLVHGAASMTSMTLALGKHGLTAHYTGDANNDGSASPALMITIHAIATVVITDAVAGPVAYGGLTALRASVQPGDATGTVTFTDSFLAAVQPAGGRVTQALGQSELLAHVAKIPAANAAVGNHQVSAAYLGDAVHLASAAATISFDVTALSTRCTLTMPATADPSRAFNLNISVTPQSATGLVTVFDSVAGSVGSGALLQGAVVMPVTLTAPGTHALTAHYAGDAIHAATESLPSFVEVSRGISSTALGAVPASVSAAVSVTLSATITPTSASGLVVFRDATRGVLGSGAVKGGVATLSLPHLSAGLYAFIAEYSGDSLLQPSQSASASTLVTLLPSTTTWSAPLPATFSAGETVSLSAQITPAEATGVVEFYDTNAGPVGRANVTHGLAQMDATRLGIGVHALHGHYLGDDRYGESGSLPLAINVTKDVTQTVMTAAQTTVTAGQAIVLNVRVSSAAEDPDGNVSVRAGSTILASAAISNVVQHQGYVSLQIDSAAVGLGALSLTAHYAGNDWNEASESLPNATTVTVIRSPTTIQLNVSPAEVAVSNNVTLTAQVSSQAAHLIAAGVITFLLDDQILKTSPLDAAGRASVAVPMPTLGTHAVTAQFSAEGLLAGSTSLPTLLTVTQPFSIAFAPNTIAASNASAGSTALTLIPLGHLQGTVALQCVSPVPYVTCAMQPTVQLRGNEAVLQIATSITVARNINAAFVMPHGPVWLAGVLCVLLPLGKRKSLRRVLSGATAALLLVLSGGCATGDNFGQLPTGPVTVTAVVSAGGVSLRTNLVVNVTP